MKKINYILFLLILLTINTQIILAIEDTNQYADIKIYLDEKGITNIDGNTNINELKNIDNSQEFTSKNKEIWTFNLTTKNKLSYYVYELHLPNYAKINYIKTTKNFRIENEKNHIVLIGTGNNETMEIIVQYSIDFKQQLISNESLTGLVITLAIIIFIIIIVLFLLPNSKLLKIKPNNKNNNNSKNDNNKENNNNNNNDNNDNKLNEEQNFIYKNLPIRQQEIITILQENKKITQKELQKKMNIPKSSISRNINSLISRNIITRTKYGQTNYLEIKKE